MKKLALILAALSFSAHSVGLFVSPEDLQDSYILNPNWHHTQIQKYIIDKNPSAAGFAEEIATQISEISRCMQIDAAYMLGLIHKESTFKPKAESPTGAAGLTQMTGPAIREIQDQLGERGTEFSRKENQFYLNNKLCQCLGKNKQTDFKNMLSFSDRKIKKKLKEETLYSVFMGAVLLKVYLADERRQAPDASFETLYLRALERYNGDTYKRRYAREVVERVQYFQENY